MAERPIASVLKTEVPAMVPGVRIPLSPPHGGAKFCRATVNNLTQFLCGGPVLRKALLLVPDFARLIVLRRKLLSTGNCDIHRGLRMCTPQMFRRELCILSDFSGKLLPNSALIPAMLRGGCTSNWINDVQRLRSVDRDPKIDEFMKAGEAAEFFSRAALDEEILKRCGGTHWDLACSYDFREGDWDNWTVLRCLSRSAPDVCHFYEQSAAVPAVIKWRKLCGYAVEDCGVSSSAEKKFKLLRATSVSGAVKAICKSVREIVVANGEAKLKKMPIAVAFSRSHGYHLALCERLQSNGTPFIDLFHRRGRAPCNFLQRSWFAYQERQKRCHCIELVRAFAAEQKWDYWRIASTKNAIIKYCQRNLSDNCGSEIIELMGLPWIALPKHAPPEDFFRACCRDLKQFIPLEGKIAPLAALYKTLFREEFLQWLSLEIAELESDETAEQLDGNAIVHLVPLEAVSSEWHGHLIVADTAADDFPRTSDRISSLDISICADDYHYTSREEKVAQIDWRLGSMIAEFSGGLGIFWGKTNSLISSEMRSVAPVFAGCSSEEFFVCETHMSGDSDDVARCDVFPPASATTVVRNGRLDSANPFGAYDFGFGDGETNRWLRPMPCKVWERIIKSPEESWFQHVLQLPMDSQWIGDDLAQLIGTSVHQIVAAKINGKQISGADSPVRDGTLGCAVAMQVSGFASDLFFQVDELQKKLFPKEVRCEVPLEGTVYVGGSEINLHGRADLILKLANGSSVIVDFKTGGSSTPLTANAVCRGDFLQLALYGKIMENSCGRCSVAVASPFSRMKQLPMEELHEEKSAEISNFWHAFSELNRTLNFGYAPKRDWTFIAFAHEQIANDIATSRRSMGGFGCCGGELQ